MTKRDLDSNGILLAFGGVILGQFVPQCMGLASNDRIVRCVVVWTALKYFNAEQVFVDRARLSGERYFGDIAKELLEPSRALERVASREPVKLLPDGVLTEFLRLGSGHDSVC